MVVGSGREGGGVRVAGVDLPTTLIILKAERQRNEVNKLTTCNKRKKLIQEAQTYCRQAKGWLLNS